MTIQSNAPIYDPSKIAAASTLEENIQEMSAEQESSQKGIQNDQEEAVNPVALQKRANLAERTQSKKEVQKQELGTEAIEAVGESDQEGEQLKDQKHGEPEAETKIGEKQAPGAAKAKGVTKAGGEELTIDSPEGKEKLFDDFAKNASQDIENMIAQIEILEKKYPDKDPTMLILSEAGNKLSQFREKLAQKEKIPGLVKDLKKAPNTSGKEVLEKSKNEFPNNYYLQNEMLLAVVADHPMDNFNLMIEFDPDIANDMQKDLSENLEVDQMISTMCQSLFAELDIPCPRIVIVAEPAHIAPYEYLIRLNDRPLVRGKIIKDHLLTEASDKQLKLSNLKFVTKVNAPGIPCFWIETKDKQAIDKLGIKSLNAMEAIFLHLKSFCTGGNIDNNPIKQMQIELVQKQFEKEHNEEIKAGEHLLKNVEMDHVEWADIRSRLILMVQSYRAVSMLLKKNIPSLERQLKHTGFNTKIKPEVSKQIAKNILNVALNPHHTVQTIIDMNKQVTLNLVSNVKK